MILPVFNLYPSPSSDPIKILLNPINDPLKTARAEPYALAFSELTDFFSNSTHLTPRLDFLKPFYYRLVSD